MGIETVSLIIAAFVEGSLGVASLMRNFRSRMCIWFAAFCGTLFTHDALSILESFDSVSRFGSPRLHTLSTLLLGPTTLLVLRELVPTYSRNVQRFVWLSVGVVSFCVALIILQPLFQTSAMLLTLAHLFYLLPTVVGLGMLWKAQTHSKLTRERLRLRYAFWGAIITVLLFLTDALHAAGVHVPPLGTMARTLLLLFIFQMFIQKELITSEEVVAKMSLFGGVALILSIIYAMLVSWVGDQPDLFFFNTLIASFVILVLFDPIRSLTTRLTRKLFLRKNSMLEDELNALSVELMGIVEPLELSRRISLSLRRGLGTENTSLYLLENEGFSYLKVSSALGPNEKVPEISASNPLVEYMTLRRGRPFVMETIESDRDSFYSAQPQKFCQSCLESMREIGADFIIPFLHESKLVGFCASATGERIILSNEQLRLFIPVSRQIAMLLKNAQIFTLIRNRDKLAAVGEMAAGLAHEIKNPLGAIKGAAQLLQEGMEVASNRQTGEFLKIILDETDRLSMVLTDFLDYAKPRRNYPQTSCDPVKVIEHTSAMILRDSHIQFEIESEKREFSIEADPEVLKQVLLNLFINALQAMEGSTPNPFLRVRVQEAKAKNIFAFAESLPIYKVWEGWDALSAGANQSFIEISVEDNGPGVKREDLSRIFTPFYTTKARGTGLGLAICQRLVEGMGGVITAKNNIPTGSVFIIQLPVKREERFEGPEVGMLPKSKNKELL